MNTLTLNLWRACAAAALEPGTSALRRIARALADQTPGHHANAYRADYLELLRGAPVEHIVLRLNAASNTPLDAAEQAHHRLLWSMIYSRREQIDELLRELQNLEKQVFWTAGERAVLAALLEKAGEPARAWRLAGKLPEVLLLAEEAAK